MKNFIKHPRQEGVTLIELMITITVLIILSTLAAPSLRTFMQNNKIAAQTNQLVSALNFSRSEAVKRRLPVVICPFNKDQDGCAPGTTNWETNGWMVFADRNRNGAYDPDDGDSTLEDGEDVLLKQWKEIQGKNDINIKPSNPGSLVFLHTGALAGDANVGMRINSVDSDPADYINDCVWIERTGRIERRKKNEICQ